MANSLASLLRMLNCSGPFAEYSLLHKHVNQLEEKKRKSYTIQTTYIVPTKELADSLKGPIGHRHLWPPNIVNILN